MAENTMLSSPMCTLLAGLRAWTSNECGAFATCSRMKSGSSQTLSPSVRMPCGGEELDRLGQQELDAELADDPLPAPLERLDRVRREDLVARQLVDEHAAPGLAGG